MWRVGACWLRAECLPGNERRANWEACLGVLLVTSTCMCHIDAVGTSLCWQACGNSSGSASGICALPFMHVQHLDVFAVV
eukprot:355990-Alexandrium_andersonii.AAC.1